MTTQMTEIVPGNALASLESEIIDLGENVSMETIATVSERVGFYMGELKRLDKILDQHMIEWIKKNGPIRISDSVRYVLTHPKTTKCNDVPATIEAVLAASGGDFKKMCDVLSAGAIKHGAASKILPPEEYAKLFSVTVKDKLEDGGPAPKEVTRIDSSFIR